MIEYEAFDENLRKEVEQLQETVHAATLRVTELRKHVPAQIAEMVKQESNVFMKAFESIPFEHDEMDDISTLTAGMKSKLFKKLTILRITE